MLAPHSAKQAQSTNKAWPKAASELKGNLCNWINSKKHEQWHYYFNQLTKAVRIRWNFQAFLQKLYMSKIFIISGLLIIILLKRLLLNWMHIAICLSRLTEKNFMSHFLFTNLLHLQPPQIQYLLMIHVVQFRCIKHKQNLSLYWQPV